MSKSLDENPNTSVKSPSKLPMIKLTILNLSGIYLKKDTISHPRNDSNSFNDISPSNSNESLSDHFTITASVSFTGSCDPSDMRVVSSALCSQSGRLLVESRPVVIPVGMMNGLIAIWDDSLPTRAIPRDDSIHYDNILAKRKGSIIAIPQALPHLFVRLDENKCSPGTKKLFSTRELMKIESNLGLSTISSLSEGPELNESDLNTLYVDGQKEKETLEHLSFPINNNDLNQHSSKTTALTADQSDQNNNNNLQSNHENIDNQDSFNQKNDLTVVNTPSQSDESASIPEILEIQVALNIERVPHHNDEYQDGDEKIAVSSACYPCAEGGGAVAHLVLFNDYLLNKLENGSHLEDKGVIALPVRKRCRTKVLGASYRNNHGSKPNLDSNDSPSKQVKSTSHRENDILVDLEENATISVRLERCTAGDDPFAEKERKKDNPDQIDHCISSSTAARFNSNPQTPSNEEEALNPTNYIKNSNFPKDDTPIPTAVSSSKIKYMDGCSFNDDSDKCSNKPQPDLTASYVNEQRIIDHNDKKGLKVANQGDKSFPNFFDQSPSLMCASAIDFEGILKTMTNLVSHCGDDVQGYDIHGVMSMDSTIHTSNSM